MCFLLFLLANCKRLCRWTNFKKKYLRSPLYPFGSCYFTTHFGAHMLGRLINNVCVLAPPLTQIHTESSVKARPHTFYPGSSFWNKIVCHWWMGYGACVLGYWKYQRWCISSKCNPNGYSFGWACTQHKVEPLIPPVNIWQQNNTPHHISAWMYLSMPICCLVSRLALTTCHLCTIITCILLFHELFIHGTHFTPEHSTRFHYIPDPSRRFHSPHDWLV